MKVSVYNIEDKVIGDIELADEFFAAPWNASLVKQALVAQDANSRESIAHAKGRGEVRGGGKKPWRQKGTGRSRHGSSRSPIWIGGGVTHGPLKDKDYSQKINKKMKRLALYTVLSRKLVDGELKIVEGLDHVVKAPVKTKDVLGCVRAFVPVRSSGLFILARANKNVMVGIKNLPKISALAVQSMNVKDVLKPKKVIFDKAAIVEMQAHFKSI